MTEELHALNDLAIAAGKALATAKHELDNFEPNEGDAHDRYDAWLDELYETPNWLSGTPSYLIKETDPVAYRCGLNDWLDAEIRERPEQFDGYAELVEAVEEAEAALAEAEAAIEDYEPEGDA